mmetsp:Transcript_32555/g.33199  ORF Transcript_32555/g.33199 Transcript_32555/m.33199 type:complete len:165 (+) Transcript_32555:172-666(+)
MGCTQSFGIHSPENLIEFHIESIYGLLRNAYGGTEHLTDELLRKEINKIIDIAQTQKTLKVAVFTSLILAIDTMDKDLPRQSNGLKYISAVAKDIVRIRSYGLQDTMTMTDRDINSHHFLKPWEKFDLKRDNTYLSNEYATTDGESTPFSSSRASAQLISYSEK